MRDVAISPDGRWIASAGNEGVVKIWELDTRKVIKEIPQHASGLKHAINVLDYNP